MSFKVKELASEFGERCVVGATGYWTTSTLIEFNSGNFNTTGSYAAIFALVLCSVGLTELLSRGEARIARWRLP